MYEALWNTVVHLFLNSALLSCVTFAIALRASCFEIRQWYISNPISSLSLAVIQSLIALVNDPQPEHPLRADLAEEYSKDRKKFLKNAEEFTKKHGEKRPMDWSPDRRIALSSLCLLSHLPNQIFMSLLPLLPPTPYHLLVYSFLPFSPTPVLSVILSRSQRAEARQRAEPC